MSVNKIKYKAGYKYQLVEDLIVKTTIIPINKITHYWFTLNIDGVLCIKTGYCWDGCSGITIDTNTNMRAGCIHDCLYQMLRLDLLDRNIWFHEINKVFYRVLIQDGMIGFRAWYYFKAVENFSWVYTLSHKEPKIIIAP